MKWYETGEVAERLQNIIDAYIDDFMDKDEFASELDALWSLLRGTERHPSGTDPST